MLPITKPIVKRPKTDYKVQNIFSNELVAGTRRLALMNLLLHNIGDIDSDNSISPADALIAPSGDYYYYILASPFSSPF